MRNHSKYFLLVFALIFTLFICAGVKAETQQKTTPVFIRLKLIEPATVGRFSVTIGGFRHDGEPWVLPNTTIEVGANTWSEWVDLSKYPFHGKMKRSGGIAEYSSIKLSVMALPAMELVKGCAFSVQLADQPNERSVVISFTEKSESNTIAFLAPTPLRENAKDFETGSQMAARHARWAKEATGGQPISLKKFDIISQLWGHYDPNLERQEALTLQSLGFNVLGNLNSSVARKIGMRTYGFTGIYYSDPDAAATEWKTIAEPYIASQRPTEDGQWKYSTMPHFVISDEVSAVDFRHVEKTKQNNWFRAFLKSKRVTNESLGKPLDQIEYPAAAMFEKKFPQDAPLQVRRLMYYAAKFGQWWSAKQMRHSSDLIRGTLPGMKTETLLPSHGFLGNAWNPYNIGMSYRMLDIFELGAQESVNQLSAEDWLGLNHMYGPAYTWTGGQTFGYYNALIRSAIGEKPIMLRGLITPSDDEYLQLKAYSSLGQGAKSFFFWTFGPTYISTENYWSDLRSQYDGIVKLNRALQKSEDVLSETKTVTDPVAILYSVSHDIWNTNNQAAFVEKRLLWHGLRHLHIQPNFLREEDIEAGKLKNYKVLYITDWCISRRASSAIDEWVKNGGVLYLSAGAATRDEFYEPFVPPFAKAVWTDNAAQKLVNERQTYNERTELPQIKPLATTNVEIGAQKFSLPVIGVRLDMRPNAKTFAAFNDGAPAGQIISYGRGQIIAVGFMPMLAYGRLANFKPTTLEEKWAPEAREIIKMALDAANSAPVAKADVPVVEVNLLSGANGSALVLANYTYQPIDSLTIDLKLAQPVRQAVSTQGSQIQLQTIEKSTGQIRLKLPLKSVDIILLK
jgi:hypothetical protein